MPLSRESILQQLEKMLAAETFFGAGRSCALLKFLVEQAVNGQSDRLKEYTIGADALDRGNAFDPRTDPIVRAEASRLRSRLERYYATEGAADTLLIVLPKGTYVPQFERRQISDPGTSVGAVGRFTRRGRAERAAWFALGGLTVGSAVLLALWARGRDEAPVYQGALQFEVELGGGDRALGSDFGTDVVLSPDGRRIAFVARGRSNGVLRLVTVGLGQRTFAELPDTDGARAPFFSPDGRWLGFWADAKLKKVSVDGGSPVTLTDAIDFGGGSWGDGDLIVAVLGPTIVRLSSTPGEAVVLADMTAEGLLPRWPVLLPGGTHVLFTAIGARGANAATIEALSLADRQRRTVLREGTFGRYLPEGHLLYINQGTLFAAPFDVSRLTAQGPGVPVLEGIAYASTFGFAQLDVSRNGTLLYRRTGGRGNLVASWIDASGQIEPVLSRPGAYTFPRLSPDGRHLAVNVVDGGAVHTDLFDRHAGRITRLRSGAQAASPVWTPDGRDVVFGGPPGGMSWLHAADPTTSRSLTTSKDLQIPWSFSVDGTRLAFHQLGPSSPGSAFDLWTVPISSAGGMLTAGTPELFLRTPYYETYPSFSPDGRWLAYGWGQLGIWEVYVRAFPPDGSKEVKVSDGGGRIARWLPGGRELMYRTDDQRLMIVDYAVRNGSFVPGKPRQWVPHRLANTGVIANFDIEPHGRRVLGLLPADRADDEQARERVTVMLHFGDEVRRRLSSTASARP